MSLELNSINALNILLLLGVLQGIIIAILLFFKNSNKLANRILASWIILLACSNLDIIIRTSQLYQVFGQRHTLFIPLSLNLFFGPLIWMFCLRRTQSAFRFKHKILLHLTPGLLEFTYYLYCYLQPLKVRQQMFGELHWPYIEPALEVVATLSFLYYLWKCIQLIRNYGKQMEDAYSDPNLDTYDWLRKFLLVLFIFSILWLCLTIFDVFVKGYQLDFIYFYPYYLLIAFISYFIGYSGYYRPETIVLPIHETSSTRKGLLSPQQLNTYQVQLEDLVRTKKIFLDPNLRAKDVAQQLDTTVQNLSYVLNQGMSISFHDYINQLRVEHVKSRLKTGDMERLTLLAIAKESGFNSESSFYRIFKKFTGYTPKRYIQIKLDGNG